MDMSKMGAFLQELRKEHGLTQEQLGEKLHISSKTISRWETGTYMPPVEMLLALSELYGVSMNELVAGERLTPEELPVKAEENLAAVMKDNDAFQLQEQKQYWQEKWLTDHRWSIALLVGVFVAVTLLFLALDMLKPIIFLAFLSMGLAVFLRNRRDDYVEHHLYDDMVEYTNPAGHASCGIIFYFFKRLSLLVASQVPKLWMTCTRMTSTITAAYSTAYL